MVKPAVEKSLLFGLMTAVLVSFTCLLGLFTVLPWQPFPGQWVFHLCYLAASGLLFYLCYNAWHDPVINPSAGSRSEPRDTTVPKNRVHRSVEPAPRKRTLRSVFTSRA